MIIFANKIFVEMIDFPCAKINLGLNVTNKRADGYHDLETVFYPINLCDKLEIEEMQRMPNDTTGCILSLDGITIEGDPKNNLVLKAYNILKGIYPELSSVSIKLTKYIPTQAGMGGGSSDGTYTFRMLNKMFNLNMSTEDVRMLASKLGADCAFFANPVPSFATGIGEQLNPVKVDLTDYYIVIVKPPLMISTKDAFAHVTPRIPEKCCRDIVTMPIETWKDLLINDFEKSVAVLYPEIREIKRILYEKGAIYASMTGSGSAVFGIFKNKPNDVKSTFEHCFTTIVHGGE